MLLGLGVIAMFAVAMLAITALVNPAQADMPNTAATDAPSAHRQRELTRFVRQECGFCHGLHLTGGLGSPLTAPALAGKPPEALEATILYGRTGTAMPAWTPHLNEADATWIVAALLKGFPQ
jgi:cytochrome c55X